MSHVHVAFSCALQLPDPPASEKYLFGQFSTEVFNYLDNLLDLLRERIQVKTELLTEYEELLFDGHRARGAELCAFRRHLRERKHFQAIVTELQLMLEALKQSKSFLDTYKLWCYRYYGLLYDMQNDLWT